MFSSLKPLTVPFVCLVVAKFGVVMRKAWIAQQDLLKNQQELLRKQHEMFSRIEALEHHCIVSVNGRLQVLEHARVMALVNVDSVMRVHNAAHNATRDDIRYVIDRIDATDTRNHNMEQTMFSSIDALKEDLTRVEIDACENWMASDDQINVMKADLTRIEGDAIENWLGEANRIDDINNVLIDKLIRIRGDLTQKCAIGAQRVPASRFQQRCSLLLVRRQLIAPLQMPARIGELLADAQTRYRVPRRHQSEQFP